MYKYLKNLNDWNIEKYKLPIYVYGGENASFDDTYDSRNKFSILIDCMDFPPIFLIKDINSDNKLWNCFPFNYRPATDLETERLNNPNSNV